MAIRRPVAKLVRMTCDCFDGEGVHFVDLFDPTWNDPKTGVYRCNECLRPLVVRGDDGRFYYVGEAVG